MPTQPSLPPLLTPYLSPPESSLNLISSVLAATGNWLILRYLYATLGPSLSPSAAIGIDDNDTGKGKKVVLLSFLHNWEFWRTEAKRLGLDLARSADKGQFAYIDGLSELFLDPPKTPASPTQPGAIPIRSQNAASARTPQPPPGRSNTNLKSSTEVGVAKRLHFSGNGTVALDGLEKDTVAVIDQLKGAKGDGGDESGVMLIVDQPDLLLAATGPGRGIGATEMMEWIMGLQQHVHSTILALSADSPLIHNTPAFGHGQATPLEIEHAAFAVGSAHRARMVMQLRNLETGAARDVSGVLRISKGGAWEGENDAGSRWEEREVLYFIQRDGGVTVFGRGES